MNRIQYNSPVILTFSIIVVMIHLVNSVLIHEFTLRYFVVRPSMSFLNPPDYFRLVSHVLGHGSWRHLFSNLTYILLLGPLLEEKYGSLTILVMMLFTAFFTGIINVLVFSTGLFGASGIVFMLIILGSIADIKQGTVPLTFILVAGIFIGTEVFNAFRGDNISQMAHIVGGSMGAAFGFALAKPLKKNKAVEKKQPVDFLESPNRWKDTDK
ncbi:rhomboid family intramembrane serine protease [Desulfonema magnum]|uniref:Rhomboid family intramembrane serine protease n=1 Tax=Desulfonema magnum TaxID=45655 RepID=A0A975BGY7_9BACT|nr:rhomboid family intramembrane serine protease [Desulfonema magnum]QTA85231.1 Rhomboid family intramembrane serine protease [Desulfonema magnum]